MSPFTQNRNLPWERYANRVGMPPKRFRRGDDFSDDQDDWDDLDDDWGSPRTLDDEDGVPSLPPLPPSERGPGRAPGPRGARMEGVRPVSRGDQSLGPIGAMLPEL